MATNSSLFVGITIGALFQGAKAFAAPQKALDSIGKTIAKINANKLKLEADRSALTRVNADIIKLENIISSLSARRAKLVVGSDEWNRANDAIGRAQTRLDQLERDKTKINVDYSALTEAEKELNRIGQLSEKIQANSAKLGEIYDKRANFRAKIADSIALGYALYKPIQKSIELESAISSVTKVVDFKDGTKGVAAFTDEIVKLTRTIPLTATELATIAAAGGQMGITEDKIVEFTELTAKMSTAFDLSAQETGDAIAKLMNVYSLDIAKTRELGDTINYLTNQMATNPAAVTEIMGRIGGSAKIFGLTTDQATALSAAFSALGKSPQVAATSINVLLNKLSTAPQQGKEFQEALEAIGMDAEQLKEAVQQDAQGAITEFLGTLKNVDKADLMGILTNLFGSGFADDIALLVGGIEQYDKALGLIGDKAKNGAMNVEFNTQAATTANQMVRLGSAWNEVLLAIGDALKPTLQFIASGLTWLAQGAASAIKWLGPLGTVIASVVAGAMALGVVIPVLGYAFTFAQAGAIHFKNAMILLRVSTIGSTIATWKQIVTEKARAFWTKTSAIAHNLLSASLWRSRIQTIGSTIATLGKIAADKTHLALTKAAALWTRRSAIAMALWQNAAKVAAAVTWVFNAALLANPIVLIGAAIAGAAVLIYTYWEPISEYFSGVWERIQIVFAPAIDFFKRVWGGVQIIVGAYAKFYSAVFGAAWNKIKSIYNGAIGFFNWITGSIASAFNSASNFIGSVFGGAWESIQAIFAPVGEFFSGVIAAIVSPFQALFDWLDEKFSWISDFFGSVFAAIGYIFGGDETDETKDAELAPAVVGETIKQIEARPIAQTAALSTAITPTPLDRNFNYIDDNDYEDSGTNDIFASSANDESDYYGSDHQSANNGFGSFAPASYPNGNAKNITITFGDIYVQNSTEAPAVIAQRIRSAVSYELEDTP